PCHPLAADLHGPARGVELLPGHGLRHPGLGPEGRRLAGFHPHRPGLAQWRRVWCRGLGGGADAVPAVLGCAAGGGPAATLAGAAELAPALTGRSPTMA